VHVPRAIWDRMSAGESLDLEDVQDSRNGWIMVHSGPSLIATIENKAGKGAPEFMPFEPEDVVLIRTQVGNESGMSLPSSAVAVFIPPAAAWPPTKLRVAELSLRTLPGQSPADRATQLNKELGELGIGPRSIREIATSDAMKRIVAESAKESAFAIHWHPPTFDGKTKTRLEYRVEYVAIGPDDSSRKERADFIRSESVDSRVDCIRSMTEAIQLPQDLESLAQA